MEDHPFEGRILDLQRFAMGVQASADDDTVQRFEALRGRPTRRVQRQQVLEPQTFHTHLTFPVKDVHSFGPMFRAARIAEKWDIDLTEGILWFSRSWTGEVVFKAYFERDPIGIRVTKIEAAGAWCDASVPAQVDFLVWSHLIGRPVPHPVPPGLLDTPERTALWSFGRFGALGWWASEGDTSETIRAVGDARIDTHEQPR
jgi:hypothetical protein